MGKYESEIHTLCEEAKWEELCEKLNSILSFKEAENHGTAGYWNNDFLHSYDDDDNSNKNHDNWNKPHDNYHEKYSNLHNHPGLRDAMKKNRQRGSMTQLTCTTTSCVSTDPSETGESYLGDRRGVSSQEEECSHDGTGLTDIASSRSYSERVESSRHDILNSQAESCTSESDVHNYDTQISLPQSRNTDHNGEYTSASDFSISPTRSDHDRHAESIKCLQDQLVSREGQNRWTPLMICSVHAPSQVISLLTKACPDACAIPDRSGSLPLHLGCWRHATLSGYRKEYQHTGDCLNGQGEIYREENAVASDADDISIENEACIVLSILIAAFPEALATANRWGHTPLHSLFESVRSLNSPKTVRLEGNESGYCLAIVETLLGKWDTEIWDYLQSNSCVMSQDGVQALKEAIQSDVKRALRTRDTKGRLPLHSAASCQWANEQIFRALVLAFPAAAWIPVIMPVNDLERSSGRSSTTSFSWEINGVIIEEDNEEDEENSHNNSIEGLFPQSGGCKGKDLAVRNFVD